MSKRPVPPVGGPRLIGYGRVSTNDQNPELQRDALLRAGVHPDNIHIDEGVSGAKAKRPALHRAFLDLQEGDTLVVWRLDRLGRSLSQLIDHANRIKQAGVGFRSLTEQIDTSTPNGMFFYHMVAAMAERERAIIAERTKAGMAIRKAQGQKMGAKVKFTPEMKREALKLMKTGKWSAVMLAKRYKISTGSIYKAFPGGVIPTRKRKPARK